ncbi:MAG: patatin-like phospholipase family protein [Wujia sp.]
MEDNKGIGLVLSGGGGKGAYQVGVLKVLQEQGLLDDVTAIAGASIGAVNAMLFAMGDIKIMYDAWKEIDMDTVFDIDLNMIAERRLYFSRNEMLAMLERFIDIEKIKADKRDIYFSISKVNEVQEAVSVEYRKLSDYDVETIKKLLLASTALPVMYEPVEIDGNQYRDGGMLDNEPIQPLYDAGIRQFIVIGLKAGKVLNTDKWPDAQFITIYPSHDLGDLIEGTLNFSDRAKEFRQMLGEKDALRALKTKFHPDDIYIRMEPVLAQNDYNDIMMQLRVNQTYRSVESRVNANIEKFNSIAKKYEDL